ncbi:hypothetical protein GCM10009817_09840 [Terrabacter lapilli]|uniref:Uncharacterized protein n=1 Tax=Terrabacter lapilli TaxID=436231 RepID=A0ABN2RNG8_9MICO
MADGVTDRLGGDQPGIGDGVVTTRGSMSCQVPDEFTSEVANLVGAPEEPVHGQSLHSDRVGCKVRGILSTPNPAASG